MKASVGDLLAEKSAGRTHLQEAPKAESQELELKDAVSYVLEEARMILPGIQALFGFQLIAVFNATFHELPKLFKDVHMLAIILTIVGIGMLMAPAAYHRYVERNSVSQSLVDYGSKFLCIGMAPLMLSICLDSFVVSYVVLESELAAICISVGALALLFSLWYVFPHVAAAKNASHSRRSE